MQNPFHASYWTQTSQFWSREDWDCETLRRKEEISSVTPHTRHPASPSCSSPARYRRCTILLHIMNNFNKIFGCRKKNKIFSKSGRAGVAFNIISTRNRYKTFKNFLWKTLFQSSRASVSCIFPSQGRIFRLKC